MGRKVEQKYEHGTYTAEFVEEIPPLGEDRKTVIAPDVPSDRVASLSGITLGVMLASVIGPLAEKFGDEVWEVAEKGMYEIGRQRAAGMARVMKIDDIKDARCVGRICDLEDSGIGIRGEWVETGKKKAVKHDYECALARPLKKCTKVCSLLWEAMERGTFDALGVKYKTPILTKIIPLGDPYCEVRVELED